MVACRLTEPFHKVQMKYAFGRECVPQFVDGSLNLFSCVLVTVLAQMGFIMNSKQVSKLYTRRPHYKIKCVP